MNSGKIRSEMYAEEPRAGPSGARSQFPSTMPLQLSEQHKSKLLSGSKSLEMESLENNKRQGYQQAMDTRGMEVAQESYRNSNPRKPITTDSKTDSQPVDRLVERRRLNLMPRSQLVDQTDESLKRERCVSLFLILCFCIC
uniref:Uncharacterized protein n=1 Tax=Rhizophora mucronata TaxID=61149 RepID=A0A2P2JQK2_RHIMU